MKMMMNRPRRSLFTRQGRLFPMPQADRRPKGLPLPLTLNSLRAPLLSLARVDEINIARQSRLVRSHAVLAQLMPSALSAIAPAPWQVGHASILTQATTSAATPWRPSTRKPMPTTDALSADPARAGCVHFLGWTHPLPSVILPLRWIPILLQPLCQGRTQSRNCHSRMEKTTQHPPKRVKLMLIKLMPSPGQRR